MREKVIEISPTIRDLKNLKEDPCSSLKGVLDLLVRPSIRPSGCPRSEVGMHLPVH